MQSLQLVGELIFQEYATLRSAKVCPTLSVERVIEGLMYNSYSWPHIHAHANHTSDVMKMSLSEALGAIERINPNHHLIFVELIREFEEVPVRLGSHLAIHLFKLPQIFSVGPLVDLIVFKEHFLRYVLLVDLVRHYVWLNERILLVRAILLPYSLLNSALPTYDLCSGVELFQVVLDGFLYIHISLSEYVTSRLTYWT